MSPGYPNVLFFFVFQSAYVFERLYPLKKTSDPHPNARRQDILLRKLPEDLAMTYKVLQEPKDVRPEPVRVIVLKNTEDFGKRGQIVTVDDPRQARDDLLLPGLAVHASEENLQKYRDIAISEDKFRFSSQDVKDVSSNFKHLNGFFQRVFFGGELLYVVSFSICLQQCVQILRFRAKVALFAPPLRLSFCKLREAQKPEKWRFLTF